MEAGLQTTAGELAAMVAVASRPGNVEAWLAGAQIFHEDERDNKYRRQIQAYYDASKNAGDLAAQAIDLAGELHV